MGNLDLDTVSNNFRMYLFLYAVVTLILFALIVAAAWQLGALLWRTRVVRRKYDETRALVAGMYASFDGLNLNDTWTQFGKRKIVVDEYGPRYTDADFRVVGMEDTTLDPVAAQDYLNDASQCQGSSQLSSLDITSTNDDYTDSSSRLCQK